jgi:hypothetical protein
MSQLADGQTVKYRIFKAKIIACTSDAPLCWYRDKIGDVMTVQERQYFQDGEADVASYWTSSGAGMGWNANLAKEDLEEL